SILAPVRQLPRESLLRDRHDRDQNGSLSGVPRAVALARGVFGEEDRACADCADFAVADFDRCCAREPEHPLAARGGVPIATRPTGFTTHEEDATAGVEL